MADCTRRELDSTFFYEYYFVSLNTRSHTVKPIKIWNLLFCCTSFRQFEVWALMKLFCFFISGHPGAFGDEKGVAPRVHNRSATYATTQRNAQKIKGGAFVRFPIDFVVEAISGVGKGYRCSRGWTRGRRDTASREGHHHRVFFFFFTPR